MKRCRRCKRLKNIKHFSESELNNRSSLCKKCVHVYYLKNRKIIIARSRKYYREHRKECIKKTSLYIKTHPEIRLKTIRNYNKTHKKQIKARQRFNNSLRFKSPPKRLCIICKKGPAEAHHCDYSKPLEIMWLCRVHHAAWHRVFQVEGV